MLTVFCGDKREQTAVSRLVDPAITQHIDPRFTDAQLVLADDASVHYEMPTSFGKETQRLRARRRGHNLYSPAMSQLSLISAWPILMSLRTHLIVSIIHHWIIDDRGFNSNNLAKLRCAWRLSMSSPIAAPDPSHPASPAHNSSFILRCSRARISEGSMLISDEI